MTHSSNEAQRYRRHRRMVPADADLAVVHDDRAHPHPEHVPKEGTGDDDSDEDGFTILAW